MIEQYFEPSGLRIAQIRQNAGALGVGEPGVSLVSVARTRWPVPIRSLAARRSATSAVEAGASPAVADWLLDSSISLIRTKDRMAHLDHYTWSQPSFDQKARLPRRFGRPLASGVDPHRRRAVAPWIAKVDKT